MIRALFWFVIYLLMFAAPDIRVTYNDGLTIKLKGWAGKTGKRKDNAPRP